MACSWGWGNQKYITREVSICSLLQDIASKKKKSGNVEDHHENITTSNCLIYSHRHSNYCWHLVMLVSYADLRKQRILQVLQGILQIAFY